MNQSNPDVTLLNNENIFVTWIEKDDNPQTSEIYAKIFDKNCLEIVKKFSISKTNYYPSLPQVRALKNNPAAIVVWESAGEKDIGVDIRAQYFTEDGKKITDEFVVNIYREENQRRPFILPRLDRTIMITWDGAGELDPQGIYKRTIQVPLLNILGI